MRKLVGLSLLLAAGCSPAAHDASHAALTSSSVTPTPAPPAAATVAMPAASTETSWASATRTPDASDPTDTGEGDRDARERVLEKGCGAADAAFTRVARAIARERAAGQVTPDADAVAARLRMAGDPSVRPRLFVASGRAPIDEAKLLPELRPQPSPSLPSRCGAAIAAAPEGSEVVVVLRAEAVADLAALPTRARTGEWLTLEARLHIAARSAKLVVLGPRGAPRTVPTSFDAATGIARARFALDEPGAFTVQLLGDVAAGPRPMLEARVFADVAPTPLGEEPAAPGEEAGGTTDDAAALGRMVAALRSEEGLSTLRRDPKLDALAVAHAVRMRDSHTVAHDLGDGDFLARFEADGSIDARAVGENVAHAPNVALAHRALHASPSHRINLLRGDYTHLGVAVARATDGSVYVCETFVSQRTR